MFVLNWLNGEVFRFNATTGETWILRHDKWVGQFKDDIAALARAIKYLETTKATPK
jgi:hypothetical protein